jgi:tRNA threonylcarbamoyladenosine biosynthesis protein TsaE
MPPAMLQYYLADAAATEILGRSLARSCPLAHAPTVLYLRGDLGAGKTTCARSLLQTLGVTGPVRSPTYTLVDSYDVGALTCVHVDLYRVKSAEETEELGLRELSVKGTLLLIEWPEHGGAAVPPADLTLQLAYGAQGRTAVIDGAGPAGKQWCTALDRDPSLKGYVSNLT